MKKKVLFMLSSMNIGGVEKSLLSLLSVLLTEKYEITILLLEKKGGFLRYLPPEISVEEAEWFKTMKPIILQPPHETIKSLFQTKKYTSILLFLYSYLRSKYLNDRYAFYKNVFKNVPIKKEEYDVAIAYQGPTDVIDYYISNKVKAKKKISWIHFDVSNHPINQKFYEKIYINFKKLYVVSNEAYKQLIRKFPSVENKTEVFFNIISSPLIHKMAKENVVFDNEFDGTKILTVGRLSKEKGQDIAIKVQSKLRKNGYNTRWYCIGDGNDRAIYEKLIDKYEMKNEFILLGETPNPYSYIANADIYVQPSRHEGFCLSIAEAKSLSKPIISTNFLGAYEQIIDGVTGLIVGCNEEELYQKIKLLIENTDKRFMLSRNLSKTIVDTTSEANKLVTFIG